MSSPATELRPREPAPRPPGASPDLGDFLLYLWRLSRPDAWLVTIVPMYVGFVLASRQIVPGFAAWAAFWGRAATDGATTAEFAGTLVTWVAESHGFLAACVAMGPLVWVATLLINDVHDLAGDRKNPRKARSPLVQGLVTKEWAHAAAYASGLAALLMGLVVNATFAAILFACLALAWAYSAPPLRLKTRPGADVLVNAVGVGGLSALAGWVVAAPLAEAPWFFMPQGLLVAAAVYVPTTLVDYDADVASGYATFATRLGRKAAYRVGFACWVLANAGAVALAALDLVIPRVMLPVLVIFAPLLVYQYHAFIGGAPDDKQTVKGIVLTSLTFLCVNLVFALLYTGLWIA